MKSAEYWADRPIAHLIPTIDKTAGRDERFSAVYVFTRDRPDYLREIIGLDWSDCTRRVFVLPTSLSCIKSIEDGSVDIINIERGKHEDAGNVQIQTSNWDLPAKRREAIFHARANFFTKILFVDDDIIFPNFPTEPRLILGALEDFYIAAMRVPDYPDLSLAGHVLRYMGHEPVVYPTGSCVGLKPLSYAPFFPDIYNEDLFAFIPAINKGKFCAAGTVRQRAYDPFATMERARFQELGDVLVDTVLEELGRSITAKLRGTHGTEESLEDMILGISWLKAIERRQRWWRAVALERFDRDAVAEAVKTAMITCASISPGQLENVAHSWLYELAKWRSVHISKETA